MAFNGQRLRKIRRLNDLTQIQLGKAIGASQRMISSYERGTDIPRADILAAICKELNMTADYFLEITEVAEAPLSSDEWALIVDSRRRGSRKALDDAMDDYMAKGDASD